MKNDKPLHYFDAPFTAFPNALLDEVMPTLKDTEWRLLCVIVRQTLGWSDGKGGRKRRDWLSQRQLMARTGRNSAALSAAIDALVRRRLVDAWDENGNLLLTAGQRRQHQGRIYYGLAQKIESPETRSPRPLAETPLRKANTTKEIEDKRNLFIKKRRNDDLVTLYQGWTSAGQIAATRHCPLKHPGKAPETTGEECIDSEFILNQEKCRTENCFS